MLKAFCLTCRQTPWREAQAREEFSRAGLQVEFFHGIHGATWGITPTLPSAIDHKTLDWHISSNHAGLCLSHYALWSHLWHSGIEQALVFEDDVCLVDNFSERLAYAMHNVPSDWQLVYVGGKPGGRTTQVAEDVITDDWPYETEALLIRQSALPVLLDRMQVARSHVDQELAYSALPHLKHYMLQPRLTTQLEVPWGEDHSTTSGTWEGIAGWFDYADLYLDQIQRHPSGTFVEVGCWLGKSTAFLGTEIKRRRLPIQVYAVDTFTGSPDEQDQLAVVEQLGGSILDRFRKNMAACGVSEIVTPIVSDSAEAATRFADGSLEFVFIDASHNYESVKRDLAAWRPKVKRGGTLAGHDIPMESVRRAVNESGLTYREVGRCWVVEM